jgi:hypothetical protein
MDKGKEKKEKKELRGTAWLLALCLLSSVEVHHHQNSTCQR